MTLFPQLAPLILLAQNVGSIIKFWGRVSPATYVYLDDAIYTGNRALYDLTDGPCIEGAPKAVAWISRMAPEKCNLVVYTLATHTIGYNYISPLIKFWADQKQISVRYYSDLQIDNRRSANSKAECLWPNSFCDDPIVEDYIWYVRGHCKNTGWQTYEFRPRDVLRPAGVPACEALFSSPAARNVVEFAFLKAGFELISDLYKTQWKQSRRPLGFEMVPSLGLGSFFITYRNIANNCPLALWWDVSGWYPLFPRKTNQATSGNS